MIKLLFISAVLLCCVMMLTLKKEYKVGLLFLATMVFTPVYIPYMPFHTANALLVFSFIVSELRDIRLFLRTRKSTLIWKLMGVIILLILITILNSPHLRAISKIVSFVCNELFFKYFAICYAFIMCRKVLAMSKLLKISMIGMFILTLFGLYNLINTSSDVLSALMEGVKSGVVAEGEAVGDKFVDADRYRVQALFANPFDYGFICVITFLLHLFAFTAKLETKKVWLTVTCCCLFGIVFCGCRTILFTFLLSLIVYCLMAFKFKRFVGYTMICIIIAIVSIPFVPAFEENVNYVFSVFDKDSDVKGSSLEMRSIQYAAVLSHVEENPVFGRGYQYFNIDLGWSEGKENLQDSNLYGLEGVYMNYILERGFLGFALYLLFYILIISYFWKYKRVNKYISGLGMSVVVAYLSFSFMTGELKSVYPTLLLVGMAIGLMETMKSQSKLTRSLLHSRVSPQKIYEYLRQRYRRKKLRIK